MLMFLQVLCDKVECIIYNAVAVYQEEHALVFAIHNSTTLVMVNYGKRERIGTATEVLGQLPSYCIETINGTQCLGDCHCLLRVLEQTTFLV